MTRQLGPGPLSVGNTGQLAGMWGLLGSRRPCQLRSYLGRRWWGLFHGALMMPRPLEFGWTRWGKAEGVPTTCRRFRPEPRKDLVAPLCVWPSRLLHYQGVLVGLASLVALASHRGNRRNGRGHRGTAWSKMGEARGGEPLGVDGAPKQPKFSGYVRWMIDVSHC
jgi:hypothetical protein